MAEATACEQGLATALTLLRENWTQTHDVLVGLAREHEPGFLWRETCRLLIRALVHFHLPRLHWDVEERLADALRDRLTVAVEWAIETGKLLPVESLDELLAAYILLKEHAGLVSRKPDAARIGVPRRFQGRKRSDAVEIVDPAEYLAKDLGYLKDVDEAHNGHEPPGAAGPMRGEPPDAN